MNKFQAIFDKQKAYFDTNVTKSYEWRIEQLGRLEKMLSENVDAFRQAVCKDFKTAVPEHVFEVAAPLNIIKSTRSHLKSWMRPESVVIPTALAASGHTAVVLREPYGVSLIIGPSNGPLILLFDPAIGALSAGNTCILKLAEANVATSALLADLVPKYFEPEAVTTVSGSREEITELLKLPYDFIFFTGSVPVGKVIMRAAAENLTPVILELGGQNPAFIEPTANLKDAAKKVVWGATAWGGQWCTSPGYAYVHESVLQEFLAEAKKAVVELYGNDPKSNVDYSRIISKKAAERLTSLIKKSTVLSGGATDPEAHYVEPTILFPVTWDDEIMKEEIFGPILPVLSYSDFDEAIREVKKRPKPLAAFLFSNDQSTKDRFLTDLSFGGGAINQVNVHLFIDTMPFGGVGNSGIGHYYGKAGFDALTHAKSILISPPDVAIEHLFPPYTAEKVEQLSQWAEYPEE
ncbi:aldehyde dehydrogenase family protein [Granulicella mallensis]|uniref:Aldehyde dehydrogenase n=1 Tax=Granulicella mallensis TaxID=940614 RepID=A0A7W7ZNU0_9BACT|nr:aldehyde dehydrogenase family protein [Granulicella mallensis]MBB5063058.1 aldehyde dehydrogenase (NAD+) [Granulicella mallensis]